MRVTNVEQLKDGMAVNATICDDITVTGKITIEDDKIYICQDTLNGAPCVDKKGYGCSWLISTRDDVWKKDGDWETSGIMLIDPPTESPSTPTESPSTKITDIKQLKDGMMVKATIGGFNVLGKITIEDDCTYICQDITEGMPCHDKKGYKYSWLMSTEGNKWVVDGSWGVSGIMIIDPPFAPPTESPPTDEVDEDEVKRPPTRPIATSYMWEGITYTKKAVGSMPIARLRSLEESSKTKLARWEHLFGNKGE